MGCSGCKAAERPEEEIAPRVGGRRRRRSNYRHDTSLGDSAQGAPLGSGASPPAQRPPHAAGAAPAAGPAGPSPVPPEPAELVHAFREACLRRRRGLLPKPLPAFASPSSYPQEPTGHVPARYASADEAFYGVIAKAQNVYCGELAELLRELRRACNPEQQARRVEQAELQLGRSLPRPCPLAPAEAAAEAAAATKRDLELDDLLDEVEMLQCFFRDSAPVPQPVPGWCASSEQASLALLPPQPPGDSRRAAAGAGLLRAGMRLLRGGRRRVPASAPQPQQPPTLCLTLPPDARGFCGELRGMDGLYEYQDTRQRARQQEYDFSKGPGHAAAGPSSSAGSSACGAPPPGPRLQPHRNGPPARRGR
eukprot:TRINITY_DN6782_c0_g1_i5.p2 TRINITY_DN6782_c0_g1~~TRINITY_DN6782_c0_g1_i5.p2  ORF type:complete len:365 (+),score=55.62 TRINITY_DN6782_c0_g1_i5:92-1186(+)